MTDLRISAQQALEALKMMRDEYEEYACPACDHADAAIYALKEALVEDAMQRFTDVNQEIEAALAEDVVTHGSAWSKDGKRIDPMSVYAEPEQEPVANRAFLERILTAMEGVIDVADRKTDEFDALRSCVIDLTMMLHAAPPQRKPLSEDEIKKLLIESAGMTIQFNDVDLRFARAIERAHGIGGQP